MPSKLSGQKTRSAPAAAPPPPKGPATPPRSAPARAGPPRDPVPRDLEFVVLSQVNIL